MGYVALQENSLQAIADAIRYKTGGTDTYKPREMAPAIRNLPNTATLQSLNVTENGVYTPETGLDGFGSVNVAVYGDFTSADEGKVVQNGALMPQTYLSVTQNGTYNTTTKDNVVVNVANAYASADEGKVVHNGALVPQTSLTVSANGTYDTTLTSSVAVNVSGGGSLLDPTGLPMTYYGDVRESDMTITKQENRIAMVYQSGSRITSFCYLDCLLLPQITKIRYHIEVDNSHYYDNSLLRRPFLGVKAARYAGSIPYPSDSNWLAINIYDNSTRFSGDAELDLSSISGICYLYFGGHGCTVTFSNLDFMYQ